ncbi:MAG TPA: hypothetical protein VG871_04750 [Vicinamibacterales bacterium]|nr:hypothetical protein [Vicinamibacterales bacterium]
MTPGQRRRVIALTALLVLLVIVAIAELRRGPARPAARPARPSNRSSGGRTEAARVPVSGLRLDLLARTDAGYPEPERNPFKFQPRPAPPPPRPAGRGRGGRAPLPPPLPAGPPPLPPIPWRLIGVADLPGGSGRVGAFSDSRGDTTWAKEGDIIDGRYRVLRVGPDSADLAYLDGQGRQSLRLSGQ